MKYHIHPPRPAKPSLTANQVKDYRPFPWIEEQDMGGALERAKSRMQVAGVWSENQILGRRYPIGCVALEITQRCNLDCTLCYLSESSESTKDIPMEEIYRRIEQIKHSYGPNTDVQITGGDPTLRKRSELMEVVRRIRDIGMRPTLMTNGIAATRDLIQELIKNGLNDIAFHVDVTEERKGFKNEMELNKIRRDYIERVRGLPIAVIFNTTVCKENFHEIPELIQFFIKNCDVVGMASFQLQADTGRGVLKKRDQVISLDTVTEQIQKGAGAKISFETARIGHPRCHRYGLTLVTNGKPFDFFDDPAFFIALIGKTVNLQIDRTRPIKALYQIFSWLFKTPEIIPIALKFIARKVHEMALDTVKAKGKINKLSFFVQNFMDADNLEPDRIHACSFMVMTPDGPISMCMHNAKRDEFILKPIALKSGEVWQPLKTAPKPAAQEA